MYNSGITSLKLLFNSSMLFCTFSEDLECSFRTKGAVVCVDER